MADKKFSQFLNGNEMQQGDQTVGLRSGINYRFDFPGAGIKDGNGTYMLQWGTVGPAAVNYPLFKNSVTLNPVEITANGSDAAISLAINPKGSGNLILDQLTWPNTDGPANSILYTNGAGVLGWTAAGFPVTVGAAGTIIRSNGVNWLASTFSIPDTFAINTMIYASAANVLAPISPHNGATLKSNASGVPGWLANPAADYKIYQSQNGNPPIWSAYALPAAAGVSGQLVKTDGTNWTYTTATFPAAAGAAGTFIQSDAVNWITSAYKLPTAVSASGTLLRSNGTDYVGTTATFANTYSASDILYSNGTNAVTGLATVNGGILTTNLAGVPSWIANPGASGRLLTSVIGDASVWTTATYPSTATVTGTILRADGTNWVRTSTTWPATILINEVLYSSASNTITGMTAATGGVMVSSNLQVPYWLANPAVTGKLLSSVNGDAPAWSTAAFPTAAGANGTLLQSNGTDWVNTTATYPGTSGSAGTILRSNGTNIVNSTSTFADTYTASNLLYSNGANTVTGLATANSAALTTNSSGVPAWTASMTNGQLLIGSTGATPTPNTLTAGTGIGISNGAGSVTISVTGSGYTWTDVSGTSQSMAVNNGYVANNVGLVTLTLPSTAAFGSTVMIQGYGSGGWRVAQNAGQTIHTGVLSTTTGVGGSLSSTNRYDSIEILCVVADTEWTILTGEKGVITVV